MKLSNKATLGNVKSKVSSAQTPYFFVCGLMSLVTMFV